MFLSFLRVWCMLHRGSVVRFQNKEYLSILSYTFSVYVILYHKIFVLFFDEVSNFRNIKLTNQKRISGQKLTVGLYDRQNLVGIYLLKVINEKPRAVCEICSKLTIKTPYNVSSFAKKFQTSFQCLLLTLNRFHT